MVTIFADFLGRLVTYDNSVDWLQLVINVIIAVATVVALFTAIRNSKDTALFSRKTLRESEENRKDDVMPILQVSNRHHTDNETEAIHLKNVGQGPLFEFKCVSPKQGVVRATPELVENDSPKYYVVVNRDDLLGGKDSVYLTYEYKDMYGRKFRAKHLFRRDGDTVRAAYETELPVKLTNGRVFADANTQA
jgi:hypothetical protein